MLLETHPLVSLYRETITKINTPYDDDLMRSEITAIQMALMLMTVVDQLEGHSESLDARIADLKTLLQQPNLSRTARMADVGNDFVARVIDSASAGEVLVVDPWIVSRESEHQDINYY